MTQALVVGSGPAGLMAAQVLAQAGARVTIAEAKPSPARKLLMAGKSGLNLTLDRDAQGFAAGYLSDAVRPYVLDFPPRRVVEFAHGLGQETFVGSSGRVFPKAMKASPLVRAWLQRLDDLGVTLHRGWRWRGLPGADGTHHFDTPSGPQAVRPEVCVLTLGGASWARLGADGAWAADFRRQGIPITDFQPSNMGFILDWSPMMARHFGAPIKPVGLFAGSHSHLGEFVISQRGIEGSGIYAVSQAIRDGAGLVLDLLPDLPLDVATARLQRQPAKATLSNRLRKGLGLGPARLALLQEWARPLPRDAAALAARVKALPAPPLHPRPIDEAISTAGGVRFDALTKGLMLRSCPGIFCAGEMLDWDAPTGGYLVTACLATGAHAGAAAARYALIDDPT